jgi:SsrA-binding protein
MLGPSARPRHAQELFSDFCYHRNVPLIQNKKAYFNYEILEKMEAGIELFGFEVKSLKNSQGSLDGSHITVRGGEVFVINMQIPPYQPVNTPKDYDPLRNRRLLVTKKEIGRLEKEAEQKGLTIVPISVYNKGRRVKMEIAVVRGKKKYDKREAIKKRDTEREIRRSLKNE